MKNHATSHLTGTVISTASDRCKVQCGDRLLDCRLRHSKSLQPEPVVGDQVTVELSDRDTCFVHQILPRKSTISRPDPRPPHGRSIIAANIDRIVVVVSVKTPPLRVKLIDRYLVAARLEGVEPVLCVNKLDLIPPDEPREPIEIQPYRDMGIDVVVCSTETGHGIDDLATLLAGKMCVLVGHSGVGKSSLINALSPELRLAVNSGRKKSGKGRHTTSASTLYRLGSEITIIDTPGIREFGLLGVSVDELRECFPEFDEHAGKCRYKDCAHTGEPDCGVRAAVRDGRIPRARYESYCRLIEDLLPHAACAGPPREIGETFECRKCGEAIASGGAGSEHRNHCPKCLHSLHLDNTPGDRAACCGGLMEPVAVWVRSGGEWAIIHRCRECGELSSNRIAADDNEVLLLSLAVRPLSRPPFPLERLDPHRE